MYVLITGRRAMDRRKDVSVGEYDARSGLTHVTRQRGRLLFNMGASVRKQRQLHPQQPTGTEDGGPSTASDESKPAIRRPTVIAPPGLRTGSFTGLSLYPEEAYYLASRGALDVYELAEDSSEEENANRPLVATELLAKLLKYQEVSLACLEVYAFLKNEKLHPRRCIDFTPVDGADEGWMQRRAPRHIDGCEDSSPRVAFDVWKSVVISDSTDEKVLPAASDDQVAATINSETPLTTATAAEPRKKKPKKAAKSLQLVFRVLVARFDDPAPSPLVISKALAASEAESPGASVKMAVVAHDRSVLLFELAGGQVAATR